jgi:hypothetical protein
MMGYPKELPRHVAGETEEHHGRLHTNKILVKALTAWTNYFRDMLKQSFRTHARLQ